jgi:hypothetical protein
MITQVGLDYSGDGIRSAARTHETVARIAILTTPIRLDVLAEILEDESRSALRTLAVVDHRAKFGAILDSPLFVIGEIRAQVDRGEPAL